MNCVKCGAEIEVKDKFCHSCGAHTFTSSTNLKVRTFFKGKWLLRLISFAALLFIVIIIKEYARNDAKQRVMSEIFPENLTNEQKLNLAKLKLAGERVRYNPPHRLDKNTILNDIFIKNNEIHYDYVINDVYLNDKNKHSFNSLAFTVFLSSMCDNPLITELNGIAVITYRFPNDTLNLTFTGSSCLSKQK